MAATISAADRGVAAWRPEAEPMTKTTVEQLRDENKLLRELVASLSAALLCNAALNLTDRRSGANGADAERLVQEGEACFRCARVPGLRQEIAAGLEIAGHELMARAVEIETERERAERSRTR